MRAARCLHARPRRRVKAIFCRSSCTYLSSVTLFAAHSHLRKLSKWLYMSTFTLVNDCKFPLCSFLSPHSSLNGNISQYECHRCRLYTSTHSTQLEALFNINFSYFFSVFCVFLLFLDSHFSLVSSFVWLKRKAARAFFFIIKTCDLRSNEKFLFTIITFSFTCVFEQQSSC